ncbi:MAG: hypothetical protein LKF74_02600 [Megasphaera sp.]|jgi:uncharacterized membrane protein YkoI|nr:hypothetical protein [Megasphaera sp.]MCH4187160.1 hypothetical protein [Megasphaera sp.]MCH4217434.1 hypothetical protein [Megasphaera sp.]
MEKKTMMNTVKEQAANIFTPRHIKQGAAVLVVCAILGGGGAWYHQQQEQTRRAQVMEARSQLIVAEAEQRNMSLIGEDQVKAIAAKTIGADESSLVFKTVALQNNVYGKDHKEGAEHKNRKEHRKDKGHRGEAEEDHQEIVTTQASKSPRTQPAPQEQAAVLPQGQPAVPPQDQPVGPSQDQAAPEQTVQQPQQMAAVDFRPVYKVECKQGNIKYKLAIDAVTGQVLRSNVES